MGLFVRAVLQSMVAAMTTASIAYAEPAAWVTVQAPEQCAADAEQFRARLSASIVGERDGDLRAEVSIRRVDNAYQATVHVRGATTVGIKTVVTPNCRETLDAAAIVLAMALGRVTEKSGAPSPVPHDAASDEVMAPTPFDAEAAQPAAPQPNGPGLRHWQPRDGAVERDSVATRAEAKRLQFAWRVLITAGADSGTLSETTPYVAVGVMPELGPLELRVAGRYGRADRRAAELYEHAAPGEGIIQQFAMLDLGACAGLGATWRVSSCTGAELALVHSAHDRAATRSIQHHDETATQLATTLTMLGAYRGGLLEPRLELEAALFALGRDDNVSILALRAGIGAAARF